MLPPGERLPDGLVDCPSCWPETGYKVRDGTRLSVDWLVGDGLFVLALLRAFCCRKRSRAEASSARRIETSSSLVAPFLRAFSSMMRCSSRRSENHRTPGVRCILYLSWIYPFAVPMRVCWTRKCSLR